MQPTKEQIKEFWEWCGFRRHEDKDGYWKGCFYWHNPPNTAVWGATWLPDIDPNNLFKYAVPKLFKMGLWYKLFSDDGYHFCIIYKDFTNDDVAASVVGTEDPALALFWAIYKVMEAL